MKSSNPVQTRIFIVDDHPAVRDGLAAQISMHPDLCVHGEANDVGPALESFEADTPDLFVIDISLPTGNGIDLIKRIRRTTAVPIVVWSMHSERLYAQRALQAGAQAYVHKSCATKEIIHAIRTVLDGRIYVSPEMTDHLLKRVAGAAASDNSRVEALSDRELEAFTFMGRGLTTEMIAQKMGCSPKTVETFRARIKSKLNITSMSELIQQATRWVIENS